MHQKFDHLTDREKEILRLLSRGHDAKSAATIMNVSVNSINERLREVRRKLGTTSSREAARTLLEAEASNSQEVWDKEIGLDAPIANVADDGDPDRRGVKKVSLLSILGVGTMLIAALILSLSLGSTDGREGISKPRPASPSAIGTSEPLQSTKGVRPVYSVAIHGTLQRQPLPSAMTLPAGGMGSMSSSGVYDMHFNVTPDTENDGNVVVSVNVVIPRVGAQSRYSRMVSVPEGQAAKFNFEPIGADPSPGTVEITAYRVKPRS